MSADPYELRALAAEAGTDGPGVDPPSGKAVPGVVYCRFSQHLMQKMRRAPGAAGRGAHIALDTLAVPRLPQQREWRSAAARAVGLPVAVRAAELLVQPRVPREHAELRQQLRWL
eukprot:7097904-Prymnesium_polylepis.1